MSLIPGLPNDVAQLCLAKVARVMLPKLRFVCTSWKRLCESKEFHDLRLEVGSAEAWIYVLPEKPPGAPFKAFSPHTNKWHELPPIPRLSEDASWQGFACVALGSTLLLMGGIHQNFDMATEGYSSGVVSGDVIVYNACTNQWSRAASMNTPRSWFAAAVIGDSVYVAGGQGKDRFLNSVEVFDSKKNSWSYVPSMICVRSSCYGLALHGKFWVIGGELMRNQYDDKPKRGSAEVYDPETCSWRLIPEMWLDSQKVPGPNTVHCGRLLFAHQNKLMIYEDDTCSWCHVGYLSGGDMFNHQFSRFGFACESLDDELYIVGGMRISRHNRHFLQSLNTTEVCKLSSQGLSKFTLWRNAADMGDGGGNVLASAVVRL